MPLLFPPPEPNLPPPVEMVCVPMPQDGLGWNRPAFRAPPLEVALPKPEELGLYGPPLPASFRSGYRPE